MLADFHIHALPDIDDGARTPEEGERMLRALGCDGVSAVVLTPHFYAELMSLETFLSDRAAAYERLLAHAPAEHPRLFLGAEVAYFPSISKSASLPRLCIEGTNILLLEPPFCRWTDELIEEIRELVCARNLRVVLAHIERYFPFGAKKYLQKLVDMGVLLQINAESLLDKKTTRALLPLLESGKIHLLGSDAHRAEGVRSPNLSEGADRLRTLCPGALSYMGEIAGALLK